MIYFWQDFNFRLTSVNETIGTQESQIKVVNKTTTSRDWNTGGERKNIEYSINVSIEKIKELVNKDNPNLLSFPTLRDAVEIGPNDFLLLFSKDSQGEPYPLIRLQKIDGVLSANLIEVGGLGSQYNWFPDSRLKGWSRVIGLDQHNFLIRHQPFQVIDVGIGQVAKMDENYVFVVSSFDEKSKKYEGSIEFKAIDLESGQIVSRLKLDPDCFKLPEFEFDHPLLSNSNEDDNKVQFSYGPKWWDKTIASDEKGRAIELSLRPDHPLKAPQLKALNVVESFESYKLTSPIKLDNDSTGNPLDFEKKSYDVIDLTVKNCSNINPNGYKKSLEEKYRQLINATAFEACFSTLEGLPKDFSKKRCKNIKIASVFNSENLKLNRIDFDYISEKKQTIPAFGYELMMVKRKYTHINNEIESVLIANAFALSQTRLLVLARGDGPWTLFFMDTKNPGIQKLTDFGFRRDSAVDGMRGQIGQLLGEGQFVYFSDPGILIKNDGFMLKFSGIMAVSGTYGAQLFEETEDQISLRFFDLGRTVDNPYDPSEVFLKTFKFSKKCFKSRKIPNFRDEFEIRANWFSSNFELARETQEIKLKFSCHQM